MMFLNGSLCKIHFARHVILFYSVPLAMKNFLGNFFLFSFIMLCNFCQLGIILPRPTDLSYVFCSFFVCLFGLLALSLSFSTSSFLLRFLFQLYFKFQRVSCSPMLFSYSNLVLLCECNISYLSVRLKDRILTCHLEA